MEKNSSPSRATQKLKSFWRVIKKTLFWGMAACFALLGVSVALYYWCFADDVDRFLTAQAQKILTEQLRREVTIGQAHLSFPNPKLVISNVAIARRHALSEGALFSAKTLQARVLLRSLISRHILIDDILVDTPTVWIEFDEQGQSNLPVFESKEESETPSRFDAKQIVERLKFPDIRLVNGSAHFAHRAQQLTVDVSRINATLSAQLLGMMIHGNLALDGGEIEYQDRGKITAAVAADFEMRGQDVSFSALTVNAGQSAVSARGTVKNIAQPELDLAVVADIALDEIDRLAQIKQNLTGRAHFDGAVAGRLAEIAASGRLDCPKGTAWKLAFAELGVNARYAQNQLALSDLAVALWDGRASGAAQLSFAGGFGYAADLTLENVNVAHVNSILDSPLDLAGPVSGSVKVQAKSADFPDLDLQARLTLRDDDVYGVHIPAATADIALRNATLFINALDANIFQGTAKASGNLALSGDFAYQAALDLAALELADIMRLIPQPPAVSGKVGGAITAQGSHFDLPHLALGGKVEVTDLNAYGARAQRLAAAVKIQDSALTFSDLAAALFDGAVTGSGQLVLAGERLPKFETALRLKNISVGAILRQFAPQVAQQGIALAGNLSGSVACSGKSFALPDIQGKAAIEGAGSVSAQNGQAPTPFDLRLESGLQDQQVKIAALRVNSAMLQMNASGAINLRGMAFDLAYDIASDNLQTLMKQAAAFIPNLPHDSPLTKFSGQIKRIAGTLRGAAADLEIAAKAELSRVDLFWAQLDELGAEIELKKNVVTVKQARAAYKSARVTAQGTVDLAGKSGVTVDFPITLAAGELADYLAIGKQTLPVSGALKQVNLRVRGALDDLQADAAVKIVNGSAWEQSFDDLTALAKLADNRVTLSSLKIKKNGGAVALKGFYDFDQSFQAEMTVSKLNFHDIDRSKSIAVQYEGKMDMTLTASGTAQQPQAQAKIVFNSLSYTGKPIEDVVCDISLKNQDMRAVVTTFRKKLIVTFDLGLTPDLPYRAELSMRQAAIEQILSVAMEWKDMTGIITGTITSTGSLNRLREASADVKLSELRLDVYGQQLKNSRPIDFVVTEKKFTVNSLEMRGKELGLFAQGFLNFQGDFNLDLDGIIDLRGVAPFLPDSAGISSLAGRAQVICSVHGTFAQPEIDGLLELTDGAVKHRDYPDPVTGLNGKIAFSRQNIEIIRLGGNVSQGSFETSGKIALAGTMLKDFAVELTGNHIAVKNVVDSLAFTVSPRIRVAGSLREQRVTGEIMVNQALYTKELDLKSVIGNKNRHISLMLPGSEKQAKSALLLDVVVKAPKDVRFKNKFADIEIRANALRIQGEPTKPRIEGRVEVAKGKIVFGDVQYDILSAVFDLLDPSRLNPEMNVQAQTKIQDYLITLQIEGNLDQFALTMNSEPPLSDSEIARLLAIGSGSAANASNLVLKPIQTIMEGQLEQALKLDRVSVDVDPLLSKNGSNSTAPSVTLAKRFFDALSLSYTTTVGGTEKKQVFEVEYELSDRLAITARRNELGEYDTSFVFRFKLK